MKTWLNRTTLFTIIIFLAGSCLYFLTRLFSLTAIPVFGDEAIYIRWSQIIRNVETLRFIPLTDGKQPLFMWIVSSIIQFFSDPLFAARLISVLAGFGNLMAIFATTSLIISLINTPQNTLKQTLKDAFTRRPFLLLLIIAIYTFTPFTFFFDRLATPDNLLAAFVPISLFLTLLLSRFPRLDISLILGAVLGLAWLTKSPALIIICLSGFTFASFHLRHPARLLLPLISAVVAFLIYNILRLGPQFHQIALRNQDYVWPLSQILRHPLDPLLPHLLDIKNIYQLYLGLPLLLFLTLFYLQRQKINRYLVIALLWWFVPLIFNAAIAKVFTARYILYTLPPLLIVFSYLIYQSTQVVSRQIMIALLFLTFIPNLRFIYHLSTRPFTTTLPSTEVGYLENWTSGWGIKPVSDYLKLRSKEANVIVGTEGAFGTLPDGLQIYSEGTKRLTIFGVGLGFTQIPPKLLDAKNAGDEVYLLVNQSRLNLLPQEINQLTPIISYPKPDGDALILYRL